MPEPILPPARVGFIGLGQMGLPMARNLARAGFALAVHDVDRKALKRACDATGAEAPGSLKSLGASCEAVITMLPDGKEVRAVVLGGGNERDSLLAGLPPGAVLLDMSSSSPVGTRELGAQLAGHGVAMLDAPVSGGVRKAAEGSLSIMVGGEAATVAHCRPLLETMGKQIFLTGPLGSGHAMKALNNYVSAAGLAAAAEAGLRGQPFRAGPRQIRGILHATPARDTATLKQVH